MNVACLIGAGYSVAAGFPATNELLDMDMDVYSRISYSRIQKVRIDFEIWREKNPTKTVEEYLRELYEYPIISSRPPFSYAVSAIAHSLGTPRDATRSHHSPRYTNRVTSPSGVQLHERFWKLIFSTFSDVGIVTTNYDLLIERALRHQTMKRRFGVGFHYGGIKNPQFLIGQSLPFTVHDQKRYVELTGKTPVCKLHGSLNWSKTKYGLVLYQDLRPAFKSDGSAAIAPPMIGKKIDEWLNPIWREAESILRRSEIWIVCGYSLPKYDVMVQEMLTRAASGAAKRLFILDPESEHLRSRYTELLTDGTVICLAGLPEGIDQLDRFLLKIKNRQ